MKKFLYPLWIMVAYLLGILACMGIAVTFHGDTGYGGVDYILGVIVIFCLVAVPLFFPAKKREV